MQKVLLTNINFKQANGYMTRLPIMVEKMQMITNVFTSLDIHKLKLTMQIV